MPEKTKLEDYSNMNNTGFAFIDLNEELKNTIEYYEEGTSPGCFSSSYGSDNRERIDYDITSDYDYGYEIENLYEKIKNIYESKKPLIIKMKCEVRDSSLSTHLFYDTIIKNCCIFKKENYYIMVINFGSLYSNTTGSLTNSDFGIIRIAISKESFGITTKYKEGK